MEFIPILCEQRTTEKNEFDMVDDYVLLSTKKTLRKFLSRAVVEAHKHGDNQQDVVDSVVGKINAVIKLFKENNPDFSGQFQLIGYGFGGCILLDTLQNQKLAREQLAQEAVESAAPAVADMQAPHVSASDDGDDDAAPPPPPEVSATKITVESVLTGKRQSQMITSLILFSKWCNIWIRDVVLLFLSDPSTLGAGGKTRLESRLKKFKPHLIYRPWLRRIYRSLQS